VTLASQTSVPGEDVPGEGPGTVPGVPGAAAVSGFHLVESAGGWTLTITMSESMLDALRPAQGPQDTSGDASDAAGAVVDVHVEPNLLPGEPFQATLVIRRCPITGS